ncbi:hypothetical protein A9P82_01730 [Arachidicoccus ginsenosidimutans]|nr:hypothetical protein A9P82_01730 [Arachidicoccus sp. BS20]
MQAKNYYQILGVSPTASSAEIKGAYRKLALRFHPDKNVGNTSTNAAFTEINEAYSILSDEKKRAAYHRENFGNFIAKKEDAHLNITPQFICEKIVEIRKSLEHTDPYRMDKPSLLLQLKQLFSAYHLAILKKENNIALNNSIIDETLTILAFLPAEQQKIITDWFKDIPQNREEKINAFLKKQQSVFFWEKYKLLFVLAATVVVCLVVYLVIR